MSSSALDGAVDYAALGSGSFSGARRPAPAARSCTRLAGTAVNEDLEMKTDEVPFPSGPGPSEAASAEELTRDLSASITMTAASMGLVLRDPEQTITRHGDPTPATRSSGELTRSSGELDALVPRTLARGPGLLVLTPRSSPILDDPDENLHETLARPFPIEADRKPAFVYPKEEEIVTRESPLRADLAAALEERLAPPRSVPGVTFLPTPMPPVPAPRSMSVEVELALAPPPTTFAQTQILPQAVLPKRASTLVHEPEPLAATAIAPSPRASHVIHTPLVMITTPDDNRTRIAPLPPMPMPLPVVVTPTPAPQLGASGMSRAATPTVHLVSRAPLPVGRIALVALVTFVLAAWIPYALRNTTLLASAPPPAATPVPMTPVAAAEGTAPTAATTPLSSSSAAATATAPLSSGSATVALTAPVPAPAPPPTMTSPHSESPRKHAKHSGRQGPVRRDP